jgi:hypothetical protein
MFHKLIPTIFLLSTSIFTVRAATLFSGSGISGTSSGEGWSLDNDMGQLSIYDDWGMPGVFSNGVDNTGDDVWNNPSADVITFTFALPDGITANFAGMFAADRLWNGSISSDGLTVTFTPLAGIPINPGDYFYLDMGFTSTYSPGDALESNSVLPDPPAIPPSRRTSRRSASVWPVSLLRGGGQFSDPLDAG